MLRSRDSKFLLRFPMDSGMLPAEKMGKKQSKLGWSYGTDHPKMYVITTFKFVVA